MVNIIVTTCFMVIMISITLFIGIGTIGTIIQVFRNTKEGS